MNEEKKTAMQELISDLKQQRDQLRVRMHLGGLDLKEEFEKLSDQLHELNQRFEPTRHAMGESAENVWESMQLMAGEIRDGFVRIARSLKS